MPADQLTLIIDRLETRNAVLHRLEVLFRVPDPPQFFRQDPEGIRRAI